VSEREEIGSGSGADAVREELEDRIRQLLATAEAASASLGDPDQLGRYRARDALGNPQEPMTAARALEASDYTGPGGMLVRRSWRGSFYRWSGGCWLELADADVDAELYLKTERALYTAKGRDGAETEKRWAPNSTKINNLTRALAAVLHTPGDTEWGSWLYGQDGVRLVACRNVLVDPLTGGQSAHTPAYFNGYALDFDYDPDAGCPAWLGFLESVWPGDSASKLLLQQWMGYVLSGRTDLQKLMYMKGLKRSGKGTIARILAALLGPGSVCGPDFESFGRDFGLELMIGRQLAVVGDARFTGDQKMMQAAIGKLLAITGEDQVQVNRKYKQAWNGTLPTRVMLMSNEMPWFKDSSAAIVDRMLLLVFKESFIGREDLTLELRLRAELAGIFNWALTGYRELMAADGRFTSPAASAEVMADFRESVSPIEAWLNAECSQEAETVRESVPLLWANWEAFCREGGHKPGTPNGFLRQVQTVWPHVSRLENKVANADGVRVRAWSGIRHRQPSD
jgi:putative DNA primase/helicase